MNTDNIMSKINDILSNPESKKAIENIMGDTGLSLPSKNAMDAFSGENIERISKAMMDNSDPKINLLYALKPYMSPVRERQIDNAIKMLRMTKLAGFFKEF